MRSGKTSALLVAIVTTLFISPLAVRSQAVVAGTYTFPPTGKENRAMTIGGVVFIGNDSFVVRACDRESMCRFARFTLRANSLQISAESDPVRAELPIYASKLHRGPDGDFLLDGTRFDTSNFEALQTLPHQYEIISEDGSLIGFREGSEWCVTDLAHSRSCIVKSAARLLGIGGDTLVVKDGGKVRFLDFANRQTGELQVRPNCMTGAKVLSAQQILIDDCGSAKIVTRTGKLKCSLGHFVFGYDGAFADQSGGKLLFVLRRRHSSVLSHVGESAIAVGTLGVGVTDEEANELLLRVIDTGTGKEIYQHIEPYRSPGAWAFADLSFDGREFVVANGDQVTVYRFTVGMNER